LLLELKRGGSEITRDNVNQATNYVQDFLGTGLIEGQPHFRVFVIGHTVSEKVQRRLEIPSRAEIEIVTYAQIVRQANRRLFRLSTTVVDK